MSGRGKDEAVIDTGFIGPLPVPKYTTSTGDEFWFNAGGNYSLTRQPKRVEETDKPRLFKVLTDDGRPPIATQRGRNDPWPLPTRNEDGSWTPGDWVEPHGKKGGELTFCQRGLHAFDADNYKEWLQYAGRIFEIEYDGAVAFDQAKWLGARARLVKEINWQPLGGHNINGSLWQQKIDNRNWNSPAQRRTNWIIGASSILKGELASRFKVRLYQQGIEKNKALFGDWYERAKEAAKHADVRYDPDWHNLREGIAEARRATTALLRAEQRVSRVIFGKKPGEARDETREMAKRFKEMAELVGMGGSYHYYDQRPWADRPEYGAATDEQIEIVGQRWFRDYVREAKTRLATIEADAAAQWDAIPDDLDFIKAIEFAEQHPELTPTPTTERKKRGR